MDRAHYVLVRLDLRWTLGASVGAHLAIAAAFVMPRAGAVAPADPAPQIAGETFELPAPETAEVPLANASPSPERAATPAPPTEGAGDQRPLPPQRARPDVRPSRAGRPSAGRAEPGQVDGTAGSTGTAALYGAVGDRSAADLATAFTRGFPQAASADPTWRTTPLGAAGTADVVFTLSETGLIEHSEVVGAPSPALASGVRRTIALLRSRPFVARGKTTRLHLTAVVTPDSIHDGLHGDVFAIGGSFTGGDGSAFFALAMGRRIDVHVRLK